MFNNRVFGLYELYFLLITHIHLLISIKFKFSIFAIPKQAV